MAHSGRLAVTHPVTLWTAFSLALLLARGPIMDVPMPRFLVWNLFLALIPFVLSIAIVRTTSKPAKLMIAVAWLAFLPNTFYLLTDIMHLSEFAARRHGVPSPIRLSNKDVFLGYDVVMLISFAAAGFSCGYGSLINVETGLKLHGLGRSLFAHVILWLSAYGIFLGRVLRLNSWDIVYHSEKLATASQAADTRRDFLEMAIFTGCYGMLLSLGYVTLVSTRPRPTKKTTQ